MIKVIPQKGQINKIKDEKRAITTNTDEIQRIISEYLLKTYIQVKWKNLEEMDKFLDAFNQSTT
jgi:hypothetical protein